LIAIRVPDLRESTHGAASRGTGFVGRESLRAKFGLERVEMVGKLRVQIRVESSATK
jgi:hypothetical protein